jgi:hypothetical protein
MAYDRIWVEKYKDGLILMDTDDENDAIVFNHLQAKQLIIDLQTLVDGKTPEDDSVVEGVE